MLSVASAQALPRHQFGLPLAHFHGADLQGITPALSRGSELNHTLDSTFDCSRAQGLRSVPLPRVDDVLAPPDPRLGPRS